MEGTFSIIRRYPAATLGSSAVVVAVVSLLQLLVLAVVSPELTPLLDAVDAADPQTVVDAVDATSWAALAFGAALVGLLSVALFVLLAGVLAVVVGQAAIGATLGFAQAWKRALPRLPRLLVGVGLVVLLVSAVWMVVAALWVLAVWLESGLGFALVALATLLALPLTVYVSVNVSLTTPALALESTERGPIGPVTALRRSWGLVRGAWWRTLGVLLLGAVIAGALSQVIAVPLGIVVSALPLSVGAALVASTVATGIGQAVAQPISGLILGLVYVDRRIRTENLDAALARAAGVDLPPAAPPAPGAAQ